MKIIDVSQQSMLLLSRLAAVAAAVIFVVVLHARAVAIIPHKADNKSVSK